MSYETEIGFSPPFIGLMNIAVPNMPFFGGLQQFQYWKS
jgi:hypothetical protein